ncbi:MAG: hypothetical protein PHS92_04485 [Candidatus Gracilibacteria bacterium]|nr:hypothetical protein [Candidatus Gracilibacteria bacterium]
MGANSFKNPEQKSIYASVLIVLSLIVLFFVTKDSYYANMEKNTNLEALTNQSQELKDELNALNKIKSDLSSSPQMQKIMNQYGGEFREDNIINNIFMANRGINISDISMDKGEKLPNGLTLANVSINLQAQKIEDLNNYYNYLTSENSNLRFVIKNTNFPFNMKNTGTLPVSISLGMYYFSK